MQTNEQEALTKLNRFKTVLENKVPEFRGKIANFYGDGSLAVFDSSVDAMNCAKDLQIAFKEDTIVPVRIGLHSGGVVFEDGNAFGDAVNIASRVESLGIPGAVLLSSSVRNQIKNQPGFQLESLGRFEFKNVEEGMTVYALANEGFPIPKREKIKGKVKSKKRKWLLPIMLTSFFLLAIIISTSIFFNKKEYLDGEVSLAVVPFRNISSDQTYNHFGMGMASEIRTKLSLSKKFKYLSSLQATNAYSNSTKTPKEIGEELNVDYLLMGMFQIAGDDIRVNIELLDAESGKSVEEIPQYQNKFTDIFQLQTEISNRVLGQFSFFNQKEKHQTEHTPDVLAYGHYLKGNAILTTGWSSIIFKNALEQFETATEIDSNYLSPWVGQIRAMTDLLWLGQSGDTLLQQKIATTMEYIEAHFPESWEKDYAKGVYQYHGLSNYEKGKQLLIKSLDENPENIQAHSTLASIYKRELNTKEAFYHFAKAKNQNPHDVNIWNEIGEVSWNQGDYEMSIEASKTMIKLGDEALGKDRLFQLAFHLGDMSLLPSDWKSSYGSIISFYENYFNQNWRSCLSILDTVTIWRYGESITKDEKLFRKAQIFHLNNQLDSSQYYANRLLNYYKTTSDKNIPEYKGFALAMLGQPTESIAAIHSGVRNNDNWIVLDEEDLLYSVIRMKAEVDNFIYLKDYKMATETLIALNEKHPNFGDYMEFQTNPFYHRIKKEYPPFAKALADLKLPELVSFDVPLKN
jgi:TolB-like protein